MLQEKMLIWKLRHGDKNALRRVYEKYKNTLFTVAVSLTNDRDIAENILRSVFVSFAKALRDFNYYGSLKSYLVTCVVNQVRQQFRKKMYEVIDLEQAEPIKPDDEQSNIADEETRLLNEALAQVSAKQLEVIILHLQGGMNFGEIAEVQGISIDRAQSRYQYGFDKLRAVMHRNVTTAGLEESIGNSHCDTTAETDGRILGEGISALEESGPTVDRISVWKIIITNPVTQLAVALVIVIAVLIAFEMFTRTADKSSPVDEVEVVEEIPEIPEPPKIPKATEVIVERVVEEPEPKPEPEPVVDVELELEMVDEMFADGDVDGLIEVLTTGELKSKLTAAVYLVQLGDMESVLRLEKLGAELGEDDPNNLFNLTATMIRAELEQEKLLAELEKKVTYSGIVSDVNDEPIEGVRVRSSLYSRQLKGLKKLEKEVVTDSNGFYEIGPLASIDQESEYRMVVFEHLDYVSWGSDANSFEQDELDVVLGRGGIIKGWLVDVNGGAVEGQVWFAGRAVSSDEGGDFEIVWPLGWKDKIAVGYAFDAEKKAGRSFFRRRGDDANDLEIIVEPLASVVGRVVDANGNAATDAQPKVAVELPAGARSYLGYRDILKRTIDANGLFRIEGITVGLPIIVYYSEDPNSTQTKPTQLQPGEELNVGDVLEKAGNKR